MRRWGGFLEALLVSFTLLAAPLAAFLLVLAEYARFAALLTALTVGLTGYFLLRLAARRNRNSSMRGLKPQIRSERRAGALCVALALALGILALILAPWIAVVVGWIGAAAGAICGLAVIGDSANKERDLEIGNLSPTDECPHIGIWARRIAALPGRLSDVEKIATDVPAPGKIRGARLATLALAASTVLAYTGVGSALAYKEVLSPRHEPEPVVEEASAAEPEPDVTPDLPPAWSDPTYEGECPSLPDPLDIGHGLGPLFRLDGALKAGCGTEAEQVLETGAWFSRGTCAGRLRSVAVAGLDGDKAILYGAAARFALQAAEGGELVSAEGAEPADGDVYVVETLAGSYGFARQASTSESDAGLVRNCTDVAGTDRPFAELYPPMMLHWRNLAERRGAWSWPLRDDGPGDALAFASYPSGAITARGACASEFSCYLEVDGVTWPGDGTSYVSLEELMPYMPPSEP